MGLRERAKTIAVAGFVGAAAAWAAAIGAKIAWPYHVPIEILLILGTPAGFLAGAVIVLVRWAVGARGRDAYNRLLDIVTCLGVITFIGGVLWMFAGAGIYGSPLAGLFTRWEPLRFWTFLPVVVGSLTLLPCALLERRWPHAGAIALAATAVLTAEAGIRASYAWDGFSDDGLILIGCISVPQLVIAGALFALGFRRYSLRAVLLCVAIAAVAVGALRLRYVHARDYWNAHSPMYYHPKYGLQLREP
jgi:hypothetical protein